MEQQYPSISTQFHTIKPVDDGDTQNYPTDGINESVKNRDSFTNSTDSKPIQKGTISVQFRHFRAINPTVISSFQSAEKDYTICSSLSQLLSIFLFFFFSHHFTHLISIGRIKKNREKTRVSKIGSLECGNFCLVSARLSLKRHYLFTHFFTAVS